MADITLSSATIITPRRTRTGSPRIITKEASTTASTAVIRVGQVVQFDILTETASHRIVRTSTGTVPNLSTNIAGIAAGSDTSDGSTFNAGNRRFISVWAADPGTEFLFPTKSVTASTLVGTGMALGFDSTLGIHYAAANSSVGDHRIRVTEVPEGTVGDTNGYVLGIFYSTAVAPSVWPR